MPADEKNEPETEVVDETTLEETPVEPEADATEAEATEADATEEEEATETEAAAEEPVAEEKPKRRSRATSWALMPAERAILAPPPGRSSIAWMVVPTGM